MGRTDLPVDEAEGAHQVSTWLQLYVLVVLGADLTQLERRSHLTVDFILLLRHLHVVLGYIRDQWWQVGVRVLTIWVQVATVKTHCHTVTSRGFMFWHMSTDSWSHNHHWHSQRLFYMWTSVTQDLFLFHLFNKNNNIIPGKKQHRSDSGTDSVKAA